MKRFLLVLFALFALCIYSTPVAIAKAVADNSVLTIEKGCTGCHAEVLEVRKAPVMPFVAVSTVENVTTINVADWHTGTAPVNKAPEKDHNTVDG